VWAVSPLWLRTTMMTAAKWWLDGSFLTSLAGYGYGESRRM
jgi:hypothetical protein